MRSGCRRLVSAVLLVVITGCVSNDASPDSTLQPDPTGPPGVVVTAPLPETTILQPGTGSLPESSVAPSTAAGSSTVVAGTAVVPVSFDDPLVLLFARCDGGAVGRRATSSLRSPRQNPTMSILG